MSVYIDRFKDLSRKTQSIVIASLIAVTGFVPVIMSTVALAAPTLMERELSTTSAVPGSAADLDWTFDTPADAGTVEFIEIEFCDSPLGACTVPNGTDFDIAADNIPELPGSPTATLGGPGGWNAPANSASRVNGRAGGTGNQIDINITTGFAGASADEATIAIPSFINDDDANVSYYTRVRMFSSDTPNVTTNMVYEGVFAQSTSQTLTVNARVQERLDFCVGSTTVNDADTTSPGADCSAIGGTSVDIGNVENGFTNVSPVLAVNGGSNTNGIAMVRTNALNGVVVDYRSLQETGSGALKAVGATCGDLTPVTGVKTDRCFNNSDTQGTFTAGEEQFGMTVAGVNCESVQAYTCDFAGGTYNLVRDAAYDGTGANTYLADADQETGTTAGGYAWLSTGLLDRIAGSATVVDDEALILKFAATAGVTTPTGAYTVQADFIATTTF